MEQTFPPPPFFGLPVVVRDLLGMMNNAWLHHVLGPAVIRLVYGRLGRLCGTLERLMAQFKAGTLRTRAPRSAAVLVERYTWPRPPRVWVGGYAWLVVLMKHRAAGYGSQLQHILEQPEMAALLAASPQARRVLRPICRMLAVRHLVITPPRAVRAKSLVPRVRREVVPPVDLPRIPLPRGVLSACRRAGFRPDP